MVQGLQHDYVLGDSNRGTCLRCGFNGEVLLVRRLNNDGTPSPAEGENCVACIRENVVSGAWVVSDEATRSRWSLPATPRAVYGELVDEAILCAGLSFEASVHDGDKFKGGIAEVRRWLTELPGSPVVVVRVVTDLGHRSRPDQDAIESIVRLLPHRPGCVMGR